MRLSAMEQDIKYIREKQRDKLNIVEISIISRNRSVLFSGTQFEPLLIVRSSINILCKCEIAKGHRIENSLNYLILDKCVIYKAGRIVELAGVLKILLVFLA